MVWSIPKEYLPSRLRLYNTPTASFQRSKLPTKRVYWYGAKQSDGEYPVMQDLWEMQSTPLLPLRVNSDPEC